MNSRAVLGIALVLALGGCRSQEPAGPDRSTTRPEVSGIHALLGRPSRLRADTVFLLAPREMEASLSRFADDEMESEEGPARILEGRGRCRIILERLTIECKAYTIKLAQSGLELLAHGDVEVRSGTQTTRARLCRADRTAITYEGDFQSDVEYPLGIRSPGP